MIEDRNLKPGTVLVARYKKAQHRCEVVAGEGGKVVFRIKGGKEFTSPSAAGSAVMGGVACNGWRFWTVAGAKDAQPTKAAKRVKTPGGGSRNAQRAAKSQSTGMEEGLAVAAVARAERPTRDDFLNELSNLRREVAALADLVATDYLSHALACFAKRRDEAGEVWLRLAVERLGANLGRPGQVPA